MKFSIQRWTPWAVQCWNGLGEARPRSFSSWAANFSNFVVRPLSQTAVIWQSRVKVKSTYRQIHKITNFGIIRQDRNINNSASFTMLSNPLFNIEIKLYSNMYYHSASSFSFFVTNKGWRKRLTDLVLDTSERMTRQANSLPLWAGPCRSWQRNTKRDHADIIFLFLLQHGQPTYFQPVTDLEGG